MRVRRRVERCADRREERARRRRRVLRCLGEPRDQRAADHDRVGAACDRERGIGIAHAEADGDRHLRAAADRPDARRQRAQVEPVGAGHAGERNIVQESLGAAAQLVQARVRGRRRGEIDLAQTRAAQRRGRVRFLDRAIDDEHAVDAGRDRFARERGVAVDLDRIEIAHQHDRRRRVVAAEFGNPTQYLLQADAARQRAFARMLDHRTVGHRIGKRHADLDQVRAGVDQRMQQRHDAVRIGIAGGDERDQPGAASCAQVGEAGVDAIVRRAVSREPGAGSRNSLLSGCRLPVTGYRLFSVHKLMPSRFAIVCTSLSPRPDRFTSIILSLAMSRASLIACATAWLDSSAARMPSVSASSWNAASASSSVAPT
jgi:hypothetical protein